MLLLVIDFRRLDGESIKESPPLSDMSGVTWTIRAKRL